MGDATHVTVLGGGGAAMTEPRGMHPSAERSESQPRSRLLAGT